MIPAIDPEKPRNIIPDGATSVTNTAPKLAMPEEKKDAIYDLIGGLEAMADVAVEESPTKTIDANSQSSKITKAIVYIILAYDIFYILAGTLVMLWEDQKKVPEGFLTLFTIGYISVMIRLGIILYQMHLEKHLGENELVYRRLSVLSALYTM